MDPLDRPVEPPDAEEPAQTLTRNWNELLQELRVLQTGIQIITGFLLTVPFSARFDALSREQVVVYLVVLSASVLTSALVVAPVAFHRTLFRRRRKAWLVVAANASARGGLAMLGVTSAGVLFLVFDVVVGLVPGLVALGVGGAVFVGLWLVVPVFGAERR